MIKLIKNVVFFLRRVITKVLTEVQKINRYSRSDYDYWVSLKGKYEGERGFVIGNGPSLRVEDLDVLKHEITIASNKIYLIFPQTDWRPTIYSIVDRILWQKIKGEVEDKFSLIHIPDNLNSTGVNKIRYWKTLLSVGKRKFSSDLSKGSYGGHTVTYDNLQIAIYLGLNPIYLIGCDHNYKGEKNVTAGIPIQQSEDQSHFVKNYRMPGEVVLPAAINEMNASFKCAKEAAEINNVEIYNATRGGKLEIFKRVNFDDLFGV